LLLHPLARIGRIPMEKATVLARQHGPEDQFGQHHIPPFVWKGWGEYHPAASDARPICCVQRTPPWVRSGVRSCVSAGAGSFGFASIWRISRGSELPPKNRRSSASSVGGNMLQPAPNSAAATTSRNSWRMTRLLSRNGRRRG